MSDQSISALTEDVEKELLEVIVSNLDQEKITTEEARELAKEFLRLLPMRDKQDLLQKLYTFSVQHTEAKGVYLKYAKPYEEEERDRKLTLMSEHLKNGNIEHAIAVAKGGQTNG